MSPQADSGARRRDPLAYATDLSAADREVIKLLQADGRTPFAQIGREVGITEKTARKRVNELIERDVIQITVVTDPELMGYGAIAIVGMRLDTARSVSAVAAELAELAAVDYVVVTAGRFHVLAEVLCSNLPELAATVQNEVVHVPGVVDYEILPYLRLHYQEPRLQAARWKSPDRHGLRRAHELDDVDRRILEQLSVDGRRSFQAMARTLGASESQIRHRVNSMVDSGAVRILGITNPRTVGFSTIAWLGIVAAPGVQAVELAERVAALASITYVVVCAGSFDILAEAICVDHHDLLSVLDNEVRQLDGVGGLEAFVGLDLYYKRVPARHSPLG